MAFAAAAIPYITAAGAAYQGIQAKQASDYNAAVSRQEATLSVNQANAQEGMVRRASRQALGAQAAAFGGAGVGYGGSSETSLDQSAQNQELDALNTRYKGAITAYGYNTKSGIDKSEGNSEAAAGSLLAGSALLKGFGSSYSTVPPAVQANPAVGYNQSING